MLIKGRKSIGAMGVDVGVGQGEQGNIIVRYPFTPQDMLSANQVWYYSKCWEYGGEQGKIPVILECIRPLQFKRGKDQDYLADHYNGLPSRQLRSELDLGKQVRQ